ncbi:MAG: pitrilysin family protein [Rhizobiaceae bacterium]
MTLKNSRVALFSLALMAGVAAAPQLQMASHTTGAAQAAEEKMGPEVTSFFLENGLQVVVIPDRRAPVVTHMVWYRAGSADEPPGKSGIAHYLEHLMFKGTKTTANGEFSSRVAAIGGQENAFTSTDYTGYFQRVTPAALEEMMTLEADRMENLVLTDELIIPERDVVQEERNSRTENNPGSLLREAMAATLYQNHPYGIPIIGWQHEVNSLDKDDAIAFYDKFYTPNNAILVVAGDVEVETVRTLAQKTYGKVKRRAEPGKRMRPTEPPPRAARRVVMEDARVRTPSYQRLYLVPSYNTAEPGEAEALEVLGDVLGGGSTSRMYKSLVIEQKIATSAGSWYQGGALDDTSFGIYGAPTDKTSLEQVEAATDKEIAKLLESGVTEDEVEQTKSRLIKQAIFSQDSQSTLARIYGGSLMLGSTIEDVQAWPDRLRAVTPEAVNKVARKYLKLKRSVTGYLSPAKQEG